jgi:hypothetical protein
VSVVDIEVDPRDRRAYVRKPAVGKSLPPVERVPSYPICRRIYCSVRRKTITNAYGQQRDELMGSGNNPWCTLLGHRFD